MSKENHTIVLASSSPRRRALLRQIGIECSVEPADIDESRAPHEPPSQYVARLAEQKATVIFQRNATSTVLAADTTISFNQEILGKPANSTDAYRMLMTLSGLQHEVLTGVCVLNRQGVFSSVCTTTVQLRKLSERQIRAYCDSGEPLGKAGSYAIQGLGAILVEKIEGSFSNVVGLPLYETSVLLERSGIHVLAQQPSNSTAPDER